MFLAACNSPDFSFRQRMIWIIETLADPFLNRARRNYNGWQWSGRYFFIYAERTANLAMDLRRLKWYDMLKLVRLFIFVPTNRVSVPVTIDGESMTQNQWIYREVLKALPANRVALWNREISRLSDPNYFHGLPALPEVYRMCETMESPPRYFGVTARHFHNYIFY